MIYKVDAWNNFCRVFELPKIYPEGFCFGGGIPTNFKMVDWFNPVPAIQIAGCDKDTWLKEVGSIKVTEVDHDELVANMKPWILRKNYVKDGSQYLVICSFGATFIFDGTEKE